MLAPISFITRFRVTLYRLTHHIITQFSLKIGQMATAIFVTSLERALPDD